MKRAILITLLYLVQSCGPVSESLYFGYTDVNFLINSSMNAIKLGNKQLFKHNMLTTIEYESLVHKYTPENAADYKSISMLTEKLNNESIGDIFSNYRGKIDSWGLIKLGDKISNGPLTIYRNNSINIRIIDSSGEKLKIDDATLFFTIIKFNGLYRHWSSTAAK